MSFEEYEPKAKEHLKSLPDDRLQERPDVSGEVSGPTETKPKRRATGLIRFRAKHRALEKQKALKAKEAAADEPQHDQPHGTGFSPSNH